jgi:hypothetical protein
VPHRLLRHSRRLPSPPLQWGPARTPGPTSLFSTTQAPERVDESLPEFGAFALRGPGRPNPISVTLVESVGVDGSVVRVNN